MEKLGRGIVKARIPILVISILLLIPAALGYINTRVNYDILYYLPKEIDTMQALISCLQLLTVHLARLSQMQIHMVLSIRQHSHLLRHLRLQPQQHYRMVQRLMIYLHRLGSLQAVLI